MTDVIRSLGLRPAGGNHASIRKLIDFYGISTDHFDRYWALRRGNHGPRRVPLESILVERSTYNRVKLKQRLYEAGLKERRCELCGQDEHWRGNRMSLILDHINGVADDNRIENLRIVCPNCNATLDTHCGRLTRIAPAPRDCPRCGVEFIPKRRSQKYCSAACGLRGTRSRKPHPERRKVERPPYEQLLQDVASMSMCAIGRKYGVSDNAVRKWLRWYEASSAADGCAVT